MKMSSTRTRQRMLALAVYFLFAARGMAQTSILVTYYTGSQQGYTIAPAGKLYFENGNLQVVQTAASTLISIPVSIIRKITFSTAAFPLPVRLTNFAVVNQQAQVMLSWQTGSESGTSHFIVERSLDGISYESIGRVASLNRSTGGSYSFTDQSPKTGTAYYRLKQVDADGKWEYSQVLMVKRTASGMLTLLPNPASGYFKISGTTGPLQVKIFSSSGRLVMAGTYTSGEQISVSKLTPGMYSVVIDNNTYKLIKH